MCVPFASSSIVINDSCLLRIHCCTIAHCVPVHALPPFSFSVGGFHRAGRCMRDRREQVGGPHACIRREDDSLAYREAVPVAEGRMRSLARRVLLCFSQLRSERASRNTHGQPDSLCRRPGDYRHSAVAATRRACRRDRHPRIRIGQRRLRPECCRCRRVGEEEQKNGRTQAGAIVLVKSAWASQWPDRTRYMGTDAPGNVAHLAVLCE